MLKLIAATVLGSFVMSQPAFSNTYKGYEALGYTVLHADAERSIELRQTEPHLVAEVTVTGDRDSAINKGFRLLADYIFGNNTSTAEASEKINMTTPVVQRAAAQKIAMTTPVVQKPTAEGQWQVQFVLPQAYTLKNLPKPNNSAVTLREEKGERILAIRFNGFATERALAGHLKKLQDYVAQEKMLMEGEPIYAFYDDPFTLPWNRRNEIWLRVQDAPGVAKTVR